MEHENEYTVSWMCISLKCKSLIEQTNRIKAAIYYERVCMCVCVCACEWNNKKKLFILTRSPRLYGKRERYPKSERGETLKRQKEAKKFYRTKKRVQKKVTRVYKRSIQLRVLFVYVKGKKNLAHRWKIKPAYKELLFLQQKANASYTEKSHSPTDWLNWTDERERNRLNLNKSKYFKVFVICLENKFVIV